VPAAGIALEDLSDGQRAAEPAVIGLVHGLLDRSGAEGAEVADGARDGCDGNPVVDGDLVRAQR
jgi:hypothetical protein